MENKPRRWGRKIAAGFAGLLVLVTVGYFVGYNATKADPAKLGAWGSDLDQALAEARKSGKLVLVKAGSQY